MGKTDEFKGCGKLTIDTAIFVLVEFKHAEFFTSYGDSLLNTKL